MLKPFAVYITCPISGKTEQQVREVLSVASLTMRASGYRVITPMDTGDPMRNLRHDGTFCPISPGSDYLSTSLMAVEESDLVLAIGVSTGVLIEIGAALGQGKPVFLVSTPPHNFFTQAPGTCGLWVHASLYQAAKSIRHHFHTFSLE